MTGRVWLPAVGPACCAWVPLVVKDHDVSLWASGRPARPRIPRHIVLFGQRLGRIKGCVWYLAYESAIILAHAGIGRADRWNSGEPHGQYFEAAQLWHSRKRDTPHASRFLRPMCHQTRAVP
ncbi:hypothetical protein BPSOL_0315 [Bifidobacterium pseudolongum]|nr:hypothetical protein BPSOL_0315 [Bifidobacterium pseudolongum]